MTYTLIRGPDGYDRIPLLLLHFIFLKSLLTIVIYFDTYYYYKDIWYFYFCLGKTNWRGFIFRLQKK
jgi:hypothetical protein